jgi:hypothetical protein
VRCIELDLVSEVRALTVAEYDDAQRQRIDQPLWARVVPTVENLTAEPARWGARITDAEAYEIQMRRLIGLDQRVG